MVVVRIVVEGIDGSDSVSGSGKQVSVEISMFSFNNFDSPWENTCVIQCGKRCLEVGG